MKTIAFTNECLVIGTKRLYQIEALEGHSLVKPGTIGGFVTKDSIIDNNSWVNEGSYVINSTLMNSSIIGKSGIIFDSVIYNSLINGRVHIDHSYVSGSKIYESDINQSITINSVMRYSTITGSFLSRSEFERSKCVISSIIIDSLILDTILEDACNIIVKCTLTDSTVGDACIVFKNDFNNAKKFFTNPEKEKRGFAISAIRLKKDNRVLLSLIRGKRLERSYVFDMNYEDDRLLEILRINECSIAYDYIKTLLSKCSVEDISARDKAIIALISKDYHTICDQLNKFDIVHRGWINIVAQLSRYMSTRNLNT